MKASIPKGLVALLAGMSLLACEQSQDIVGTDGSDIQASMHESSELVCRTVDFSGFEHADAVSQVSADFGGSLGTIGFDVSSSSTLSGATATAFDVDDNTVTADPDLRSDPTGGGDCSACDGQGTVLVIGEPNFEAEGDADEPGTISMTRQDAGSFVVASFLSFDQEEDEGEGMRLVRDFTSVASDGSSLVGGTTVAPFSASFSANADLTTVNNTEPNTLGMAFGWDFRGSGAIDDIEICVEEPGDGGGGEGCTPGYWKQEQHFDSWQDYSTDDDFCTVFGLSSGLCGTDLQRPESGTLDDLTLLEALELRGGGVNALVRHAVAGLLNADNDDVSYDWSESEVISAFTGAIDGGDIEGTKDMLEEFNEQGCPLD